MSTKLDPITYFGNFNNVYFISKNKWQELTSFSYSLLLGQSQLKLQVSILPWKGRQNFAPNVTLCPCKRSRQGHLDSTIAKSVQ